MDKTILIIEDEEDIRDILRHYLEKENFKVREAEEGKEGIRLVNSEDIDLIILDLMLPDTSGYDVCKDISLKYNIPIIMLTAKNDIVDKLLGLELGADDYVTKPFDVREVIARVKVCLKRIDSLKKQRTANVIQLPNSIKIYVDSREVIKGENVIKLKPKEYELLLMLSLNRKIVLTRERLLEKVWGFEFEGDSRTVDVHIQRIRKKLQVKGDKPIIETVFGVGYKML
ncbi:transcriptional regulatory protein WalR [Clostridium pasteurianum DSM 525 = ATCC 6013]|uniref:Stage 0 sporulation protein A homolog n=1 Tax=Clostridium pasteurianum DSM 525 = ATCC 6013 TaxID=1262449 RepID=A0A0H3J6D3_CLOPA|nr:response regulator transcription factor [Clostridium pasteurianum]AJA47468.1 transcriptional regulatory protein WalR [Clostridium pasteurianum DSM 525 = ATCC 6013]AJA51456.1 transcriptional regulatory protein WalR [Clostridium pasteurianum DSM 525 = ATCC 6013]AOZ74791.1 XRE family transcriptional regulator [Clostridium pasteurianum DSM 525 = ATCC 6013]AOZ78587.1 XRE family transcriptional regulator [Clostridium pasteurianum]ELP58803.1 transcriptional regulator [Clostridium pasteurianum DSM 